MRKLEKKFKEIQALKSKLEYVMTEMQEMETAKDEEIEDLKTEIQSLRDVKIRF